MDYGILEQITGADNISLPFVNGAAYKSFPESDKKSQNHIKLKADFFT